MRVSSVERRGIGFAEHGYDPERPPDRVGATADPRGPEAAAEFERIRSQLFAVAYRIMGRAADAEDVVQDVWVRWQRADRAGVRDRVAFLVTITKRAALNAATSACARREVSAGGRLPERDTASADPVLEAERAEGLQYAVRLLTNRLPPAELAVFVLREAFDYPFREIAGELGLSEVNARQLARRARDRLAGQRHDTVGTVPPDGLVEAFLGAARAGDMAQLIDALAGGGVRRRGRRAHHIAR